MQHHVMPPLQLLKHYIRAGVLNHSQTWGVIHPFLLTAGSMVINEDNLMKCHGNLLKMLLIRPTIASMFTSYSIV